MTASSDVAAPLAARARHGRPHADPPPAAGHRPPRALPQVRPGGYRWPRPLTRPVAPRRPRKARRAEKAPSGGWRTIAAKELADHLGSVRFFVLLIVIAAFAALPMIFRSQRAQQRRAAAVRLARPVPRAVRDGRRRASAASRRSPSSPCWCRSSASRSGSTASTASAARARSPGCSPSPSTATTSSTASSRPGSASSALMLAALVAFVAGLGIVRLGIIPGPEELARIVAVARLRRSCTRRSGSRSRCCSRSCSGARRPRRSSGSGAGSG